MANHSPLFQVTRVSAAVTICLASCAWAQQNPTEITIVDTLPTQVSGFGDVSARDLPFSTTIINQSTLQDIGARRVSDALHLDASVTDSYNSPAYWDILSVRGFTLDNRYNYRREGMPISAETMIPMDNKERIELLKGTSGIQAGTSAPGGLVNYVVKRAPTNAEQTIRTMTLSYGEGNNKLAAADLGGRFGNVGEFGYRLNVAYEDLNPYIGDTKGHRNLVALAMDWRLKPGTVIDVEFEQSHRQQIGINGYSLLEGKLPAPVDPRVNLTRQSWSLPGAFDATTGSVKLRQTLANDWLWSAQLGTQRLKTDDRLTYGFGYNCFSSLSSPSSPAIVCGQFTSDGKYEIDDYRSENEKRYVDVFQTEISGEAELLNLKHHMTIGFQRLRQLDRLPTLQTWQAAGEGSIYGGSSSSANPTPNFGNTNRSEYATEISVKDRVSLSESTQLWAGLRRVEFNRSSVQNDNPSTSKQYQQSINLPWLAVSQKLSRSTVVYGSHGHGVEQFVVPNNALYVDSGTQLGIGRSKQTEIGVRHEVVPQQWMWNAAIFQIQRPLAYDVYDANNYVYTRHLDGTQKHQGLELGTHYAKNNLTLGAQIQALRATIADVEQTSGVIGNKPTNVPSFVFRGLAEYRYSSVPGLRTNLRVSHESERNVLEDGSVKLPAWTTWGTAAHYDTKVNNVASTWSLAIDNLTDKRYWRESPKQFGHYYLYPGAPLTVRASVQFKL